MQLNDHHKKPSPPLSPRLSVYRWRAPMIASIAHRASGLVLVLFVPFYLWVLRGMTGSPEDFEQAFDLLHTPIGRLTLWMVGVAFVYHFCNGIRFLTLDAGWCESHAMLRLSARIVLAIAALAALLFAALLW
jgi:succinate dehydrogenase / fumarate reductase cytochrome b subunit